MTHGSLFSGIGGFDLAARWAGWKNIFQVEIDPWCQKILAKHFPNAQRFTDIRDFDGSAWRGAVDVISGGFPCQPYSSAGKRLGKEDARHLWPEMLRVIREAAPRWVVGENVRGLVGWSGGLVFHEVQTDLEAAGYEVQPFLLPAASVGAPHLRYRVWFVAYRASEQVGIAGQSREHGGLEWATSDAEQLQGGNGREFAMQRRRQGKAKQVGMGGITTINTIGSRLEERQRVAGNNESEQPPTIGANYGWEWWPTLPPVCGRNDGFPNRVDRIRGLGNAVVPQLVWRIFDTINQYEQ